jgi:hypothetical protein
MFLLDKAGKIQMTRLHCSQAETLEACIRFLCVPKCDFLILFWHKIGRRHKDGSIYISNGRTYWRVFCFVPDDWIILKTMIASHNRNCTVKKVKLSL